MSIIKEISPASPLLTLLLKMKGQVNNKADADRAYQQVYPALEEFLAKGYSFDSPEVQGIVELLGEMPAYGARRENFKKLYLRDEITLRKLPRDPRLIPSGLWH